jgi:branched-chain amino acid transport system substrate-binding protein
MGKLARAVGIAATVGALIAAAACGSSDSGSTERSSSGSTESSTASTTSDGAGESGSGDAGSGDAACTTQGISDAKEIHLGAWAPRSGPLAGIGSSPGDGADLAFQEMNEKGGINGYTIKYTMVDDGADPTRTVGAARTLWNEDKVFALFMPYGSGPNNAAKQFILDNNVLTLFPYANSDIFFPAGQPVPPYVFGWYPPYWALVAQLSDYLVNEHQVKKVAVLHTIDDYGKAGQKGVEDAAKRLGIEVVADIGYDSSETNYAPLGRKVADSGADAVFAWAIPGATNIIKAAEEAGYSGLWAVQSGLFGKYAEDQMASTPSLADRTYLSNFQLMRNDGDPEVAAFIERFVAKYPKADPDLAVQGWSEALVLEQAIKAATDGGDPLTCQSLTDALQSLSGVTVGAAVDVGYSADSHFGSSKGRVYVWDGKHYKSVTEFTTFPGME